MKPHMNSCLISNGQSHVSIDFPSSLSILDTLVLVILSHFKVSSEPVILYHKTKKIVIFFFFYLIKHNSYIIMHTLVTPTCHDSVCHSVSCYVYESDAFINVFFSRIMVLQTLWMDCSLVTVPQ